jgi:hypothetical protein
MTPPPHVVAAILEDGQIADAAASVEPGVRRRLPRPFVFLRAHPDVELQLLSNLARDYVAVHERTEPGAQEAKEAHGLRRS